MKIDEGAEGQLLNRLLARAGFKIVATGMRQCLSAAGEPPMTEEQMEKMFLTLA